jgi:hypothetical protein
MSIVNEYSVLNLKTNEIFGDSEELWGLLGLIGVRYPTTTRRNARPTDNKAIGQVVQGHVPTWAGPFIYFDTSTSLRVDILLMASL